jgi:hypothetical protein
MIETYVAFFRRQDYQAVKAIFSGHPDFPDSYDEWFHLARKQFLEDQSRGHSLKEVVVDPNQFARFCDRTNRPRDLAALNAFLIEEASRQENRGAPFFLRDESGGLDTGV